MKRRIITISREFNAGGDEIAAKLATLLQIPLIGRDEIKARMKQKGIEGDTFDRYDERSTNSFLYSLAITSVSGHIPGGLEDLMMGDKFFDLQSKVLLECATEADGVFVGRCADFILGQKYSPIKIFIHAPFDDRVTRTENEYNLKRSHAETLVKKSDKKRASYYSFFTGKTWGESSNYDFTLNASIMDTDSCAFALQDLINRLINSYNNF